MQSPLLSFIFLLMAICANSAPVTITAGGAPSEPDTAIPASASPGIIVEAPGTDVVAGNESNTDDPGKTIFVPTDSGATVIPTQEDPSVLAPGGITVTISGGSDGVVVVPGQQPGATP